ncbi:MAG: DUF4393 domain-containing protein [Pseudoxanthomonas sp.]
MTSGIDKAKASVEIIGEVIRLAGDDPQVKQAAGELGKTAVTITKTINNALLPLAAVNFAFDKARKYFSEKFELDIQEKAKKIPSESLIEPKASVAGPALQALAFVHEEDALKDLFLELIAGAMDARKASIAHPAFVEILKQLQSEEAKLLKSILPNQNLPIGQIRRIGKSSKGFTVVCSHVLNIVSLGTKQPVPSLGLPAMIDNWIRLGLVDVDYDKKLTDKSGYDWLNERPEMAAVAPESEESEYTIEWQCGVLVVTDFGKQFARSVGILV